MSMGVFMVLVFLLVGCKADHGSRTGVVVAENLEPKRAVFHVKVGRQTRHVFEPCFFRVAAAFRAVQPFLGVFQGRVPEVFFLEALLKIKVAFGCNGFK